MAKSFKDAVNFVNSGEPDKEFDNKTKLSFYSFYKQATVGPCALHGGSQPWAVNFEKRMKYDAWSALGNMTTEEAENKYCQLLDDIIPRWNS